MAGIIDIALLKRYAKDYDPVLRTLPFVGMNEVVSALKLNLVEVQDEDVITNFRRKAGNTGPYKAGAAISYPTELGKIFETSLKPELTVSRSKDNILNYTDKRVLSNAGEKVDFTTKKHPLEKLIVDNMIISHIEDVVFSMFFAERDDAVFSPATAFDGFFTKMDGYMVGNEVTEALGNLHITGAFGLKEGDPGYDGKNDYERLVDFVKSAHPLLKVTGILDITSGCALKALAGYRKLVNNFERPKLEDMFKALNDDAQANITAVTHLALGTGDRLQLRKSGLLDFGINSKKSQSFIQIRDIYEDPHEVQFWQECAYGVRYQDIHKKVFQTNEQKNTAIALAGDYI